MSGGRLTFRRRHRLTHAREYQRVAAERVRKSAGPLVVSIAPSGLDQHRLGLAVGRRVGSAVVRNRIKRNLRESFRQARDQFPRPTAGGSYDIVVGLRPHQALGQREYQALLVELVGQGHAVCERRSRREGSAPEHSS